MKIREAAIAAGRGTNMNQIGFDNDKYLAMQSRHIQERIAQFDNKLYLEFGGKLFDDLPRLPGAARLRAGQQDPDAAGS